MEFEILGPVVAYDRRQRIVLGRRRERGLLALLLLEAGSVIPAERLVALLWDDQPPASARASLRTHVARVRRQLGLERSPSAKSPLRSLDGGYVLDVHRNNVDAHRFRRVVERAIVITDPALRSAQLRDALALWRGPFLADAGSDRLRDRIGGDLGHLRLAVTEEAIDADLACGRELELIGELTVLTAEHPLHEGFAAQLMTALYRRGMQAEALRVHELICAELDDRLGVRPGPALEQVHVAILRHDLPAVRPGSARMATAMATDAATRVRRYSSSR